MRLLPLFLVCVPALGFAWGADGHKQIADIAWTKLTPTAKAKLEKILNAGEPSFQIKGSNVRSAFDDAATFCDYMKNKTDTVYEDIIPAMNSKFNANIESIGREGSRCKTWHYYDLPIRYTGSTPEIDPSNANAALTTAISELSKLNKGGLTDAKMACWWLYWIEHVTGDLHQPLHCVSSFEFNPKGDAGGNGFKIQRLGGESTTSLHSFWDGGIGQAIREDREKSKSANIEQVSERWGADKGIQPASSDVKDLEPMDWIKNGAKLADRYVYGNLKQGERPDMNYLFVQADLCRKQAVLGGYRLAAILNKALG